MDTKQDNLLVEHLTKINDHLEKQNLLIKELILILFTQCERDKEDCINTFPILCERLKSIFDEKRT